MGNNQSMNIESFYRQIDIDIALLKLRWKSAKTAYRKSECWEYEQANKADFQSHKLPLSPGQRRHSYKPHLLRKDECLVEIRQAIQALVAWRRCPSEDFPLDSLKWAERCFEFLAWEWRRPRETATDLVRYNWRVVKIIEGADSQNQAAIKRGEDTMWTDYRVRKVVAGVIERHPEEFKFREDLWSPIDSGSVKSAVRDAIRDRGVHLPEKPRNKGRGRDS